MALPLWFWGVLICVAATAMTALGLVLQKFSHTLNAKTSKSVVYYRQQWWLVGFFIFAIAQVVNLISMSMAPQVMLSCLGATALVFNAVFARMILEEELHRFELLVMLGMVSAVVMVISNTPVTSGSATETALSNIVGPLFEFRFLAIAAFVLVSLFTLRCAVDMRFVRSFPALDPLTWALCAAASSGYTVNLFKATSEFVMAWPTTRPLVHWECYVTLIAALGFGISQVHCLNRALNAGRAMMVVPTYFALGLLSQLGIAETIVSDFPRTTLGRAIFISGIVLILVFIVLLVRAKIAYEEQPDAEIEEVLGRTFSDTWPSSPVNARDPSDTTALLAAVPKPPLIQQNWKSMPDLETDATDPLPIPRQTRCSSCSALDAEAFQDSFEGRERMYSVSLIGLGIA